MSDQCLHLDRRCKSWEECARRLAIDSAKRVEEMLRLMPSEHLLAAGIDPDDTESMRARAPSASETHAKVKSAVADPAGRGLRDALLGYADALENESQRPSEPLADGTRVCGVSGPEMGTIISAPTVVVRWDGDPPGHTTDECTCNLIPIEARTNEAKSLHERLDLPRAEDSEFFRQLVNRYAGLGELRAVVDLDLRRLIEWARCDRDPRTNEAPPTHSMSAEFDPEHCSVCKEWSDRHKTPKPKVEVKSELWESARFKMRQLEREIHSCSANQREKSNMMHSFSKLCMFASDAWELHVIRPAQRVDKAPVKRPPAAPPRRLTPPHGASREEIEDYEAWSRANPRTETPLVTKEATDK